MFWWRGDTDITDNMGDEAWTTIDRKTSKKKNKEEAADEGWEQVNKKDNRKKKDSVVSNGGGQESRGRNGGQRGG